MTTNVIRYWLFTNNYFLPFKGFFLEKKDAEEKALYLMKKSFKAYKKELKLASKEEVLRNESLKEDNRNFDAQNEYSKFKKFSKNQINESIKLMKICNLSLEDQDKIFDKEINQCFT